MLPDKVVDLPGGHSRTVRARLVSWRCEWCTSCDGCEVTEWRYPGPLPRYHEVCPVCGQHCKKEAQNSMAAGLMRRRRLAELESSRVRRRPVGRPRAHR
jgi:hypothetical protein